MQFFFLSKFSEAGLHRDSCLRSPGLQAGLKGKEQGWSWSPGSVCVLPGMSLTFGGVSVSTHRPQSDHGGTKNPP